MEVGESVVGHIDAEVKAADEDDGTDEANGPEESLECCQFHELT